MEEGLLLHRETSISVSGGGYEQDLKKLGYIAAPMIVVVLSQYMVQLISTMMVGHIGEVALAASSIGTSLSSVTGFSLLLGLASGLETLCGQAFGARQYQKLGVHMYKAIFCLVLVCIPITIVWVYLGRLLVLMGQDPTISREAGRYVFWLIPGLFANAVVQPLMKFLQAQSLIVPMLFSGLGTLCLHVPLCWALVFKSGMGIIGAALANSISFWLNVIILGLYVNYSSMCKETRAPITKEAFQQLEQFFKLALPSAIMICLEWWSFELLVLLSGILPNPQLETSVVSICLMTISTLYAIPYGLGTATSTRVSNELGQGNPQGARTVVIVSMCVAITEATIVSMTIFSLRRIFGFAFSNEEEVISYVKKMAPLISISIISDGLQGVLSGIARGAGWQHIGAYVNLGAYYLVGIPIAATFAFWLDLRGQGLWIGILSGAIIQTVLLALITFFTNWQKQANMARERIFDERLEDNPLK